MLRFNTSKAQKGYHIVGDRKGYLLVASAGATAESIASAIDDSGTLMAPTDDRALAERFFYRNGSNGSDEDDYYDDHDEDESSEMKPADLNEGGLFYSHRVRILVATITSLCLMLSLTYSHLHGDNNDEGVVLTPLKGAFALFSSTSQPISSPTSSPSPAPTSLPTAPPTPQPTPEPAPETWNSFEQLNRWQKIESRINADPLEPYPFETDANADMTQFYKWQFSTMKRDTGKVIIHVQEDRYILGKGYLPSLGGTSFHIDYKILGHDHVGDGVSDALFPPPPIDLTEEEIAKAAAEKHPLVPRRMPLRDAPVQGSRVITATTCAYTDHFDGTYVITCRPPMFEGLGVSYLTVEVYYMGFSPYRSNRPPGKPLQKLIHSEFWNDGVFASDEERKAKGLQSLTTMNAMLEAFTECQGPQLRQLQEEGEWVEVKGLLRWVHPTLKCITPTQSKEKAKQCLENVHSLATLGDSHVRHITKWIWFVGRAYVGGNGKAMAWNQEDAVVSYQYRFYWSPRVNELSRNLERFVKSDPDHPDQPLTNQDIVIMNSAHWNLDSGSINSYIHDALPQLIEQIKRIRDDPMRQNVRLIWVSTHPMPPDYDGKFRNEFASRSCDSWLNPQLEALGVEIVKIVDMIAPRAKLSTDDHHWGHDHDEEGEGNYVGSVAVEWNRMLTQMICDGPSR